MPRYFLSGALASIFSSTLGIAIACGALVIGATAYQTLFLQLYGWSLFCIAPFIQGLVCSIIFCATRPEATRNRCHLVSLLSILCVFLSMLLFAWEGVICLAMALPIWLPITLLGSFLGHKVRQQSMSGKTLSIMLLLLTVSLPLSAGFNYATEQTPPVYKVVSSVKIDAAPTIVWPIVIAFPSIPKPQEWIFKTGIAYPIDATIEGRGVGAIRHCNFTTGPFVEPITAWNEPHLLAFDVTQNPAPMKEFSFHTEIHPPHLEGYMMSHKGQFKLIEQDDGSTLLEGTTWYSNRMGPQIYWKIWSDQIIHKIHARVLNHIKAQVEKP